MGANILRCGSDLLLFVKNVVEGVSFFINGNAGIVIISETENVKENSYLSFEMSSKGESKKGC